MNKKEKKQLETAIKTLIAENNPELQPKIDILQGILNGEAPEADNSNNENLENN